MINVILNCFKKLAPGSKTNYVSPSNDIVLVWFFLSLLLLLLSEACPDHNLCRGSELITGRCRLRNTTGISTWTIPLHLLHQWPPRPATIHCSTICERHYRLPHYNIWGWCRTPPGRPWQTRTMGRRLVHAVPSSKMYSPHRHQQAEPHSDRVFHSRTITCSSYISQVPGGYHHWQSELESTHQFHHKQGE